MNIKTKKDLKQLIETIINKRMHETASRSAINRMSGLVTIKYLQDYKRAIKEIRSDLEAEEFEKTDIDEFLKYILDTTI
jgi:SOS response regulatory protein OraA/RecX